MKKTPTITLITCLLAFLIAGGIFEYKKDSLLSKEKGCEQMLDTFQKRVIAQQNYLDNTFQNKFYDFMVGYSPSLNTCVGGYTQNTQIGDYIKYNYSISNVLTNSYVDSYDTLGELIKHPEIGTTTSAYDTASQYAWQDYKKKLSDLTEGQIK